MKVKVLRAFLDHENLSHRYQVGEVVEFETSRARNIIAIGYGEEVVEGKPAKAAPATAPAPEPEPAKVEEPVEEKVEENAKPAPKRGSRKK